MTLCGVGRIHGINQTFNFLSKKECQSSACWFLYSSAVAVRQIVMNLVVVSNGLFIPVLPIYA